MVNSNALQTTRIANNTIDIPIEELRWCTVSLSEVLSQNKRLEASVFDITGKHARDVLKKCKWDIVNMWSEKGLVKDAQYPGRFKRIYVEKGNGIPFYLPSQISDINPKPNKFISKKTEVDIETLKVRKGELLLTRSGTIGNCTIVSQTLDDKVFSDDVIRITFKNDHDISFVYAFLKTEIGSTLLHTNSYGAVISHIEPEHLRNIPIPNPNNILKNQVHSLITDSFKLREQSNELISEANKLFIKELDLPPIDKINIDYFSNTDDIESYSVKLSVLGNRIDGSFHRPTVSSILKCFETNAERITTIGYKDISQGIKLPGRFKRVYVEKGQGTAFFGGKSIFELDPLNKKYLSLRHHHKQLEDLKLIENMILITRSGTIGNVNIVPKHWEDWVINEHVIRVIPSSDEIAGYLYIYLSSDYGYELIRRFTYGSVVDEIDSNHVSNIEVPLLKNKKVQEKINNLALEANKMRYEAYRLEQQAIRIVNDQVIHAEY